MKKEEECKIEKGEHLINAFEPISK